MVVKNLNINVHLVLGFSIGPKAFPSDSSGGKAVVLSLFEKNSIPSAALFANKIIEHETKTDEELIICFVLVAMTSFSYFTISLIIVHQLCNI
ncbi:hypothetical protein PVAP13_8NG101400 [Panicum virgatum]|uniref:Uncharacterized protein n=1 Tax=Panicum virgatum TaxID=38727 RepID=A0A8T0PIQ5_PANVG|nr:hypothetical protein PVAP13_8NG101400 [Panicum virgatum]